MSPNKPPDDQQRFGAISETHPALISTKVVMMKWSLDPQHFSGVIWGKGFVHTSMEWVCENCKK
jgi:hypothetical protein